LLKRFAPPLAVLLSILLDTAILPVFYYGRYLIPASLIVVILIGIQLGRMNGMLYGMIAGLLLDISTGTLGMNLFPYLLIGFLIGFLLDQQPEISRSSDRKERLQLIAVRVIWIFALLSLYETVILVYQYFSTAIFEWKYVRDLFLRVAAVTALCMLLHPFFHALFIGKTRKTAAGRRAFREVKHF